MTKSSIKPHDHGRSCDVIIRQQIIFFTSSILLCILWFLHAQWWWLEQHTHSNIISKIMQELRAVVRKKLQINRTWWPKQSGVVRPRYMRAFMMGLPACCLRDGGNDTQVARLTSQQRRKCFTVTSASSVLSRAEQRRLLLWDYLAFNIYMREGRRSSGWVSISKFPALIFMQVVAIRRPHVAMPTLLRRQNSS